MSSKVRPSERPSDRPSVRPTVRPSVRQSDYDTILLSVYDTILLSVYDTIPNSDSATDFFKNNPDYATILQSDSDTRHNSDFEGYIFQIFQTKNNLFLFSILGPVDLP